jgi:hypothetical protein
MTYEEEGDDDEVDVDTPDLDDGEDEVDRGRFGSVGWYVLLAQRIDPATALEAVDGWGGDAYVVYERDDTVCARIAYEGDTDDDASELADALDAWADEMPQGAASVERTDDDGLVLDSCDPGDDASVPDDITAEDLMLLPVSRATLGAVILSQGANLDQARCFASEAVAVLDRDQLQADELDAETMGQLQAIGLRCR